ncbi:MAG: penicillin-binding transpeptidase domain-containing protein [Candidatus Paceibacterota bacterium]|jgi:penicillin-binding protein 2
MNRKRRVQIDPDEIFLDAENLPAFDVHQFEGRIEKPISLASIIVLSSVFGLLALVLVAKDWSLQVKNGNSFAQMSENNMVRQTLIFSERGAIADRNGVKLAWNASNPNDPDFSLRKYASQDGFAHLLGYLKYPAKDKSGFYYRDQFEGVAGIEKVFDSELQGEHGLKIVSVDAFGKTDSESVIRQPRDGQNLTLSIDSVFQGKLYDEIKALAERVGFSGGAGAMIDVRTGEILALTSYPEYSSQVMTDGTNSRLISQYLTDNKNKPFLNRIISGLYTPGSIVKPYVALAALTEKTIDPATQILSTGSISVPNPYDPTRKTTFMDWKAHGLVDMRTAIAVSSNVYFYEVGGGFEGQEGLGIDRLNKYFSLFGLGRSSDGGIFDGPTGTVPSPAWKDKVFPGDPWRIGDTYFTSIGQYGFQVTPLQMLKAVASIANSGTLLHPTILKDDGLTPIEGDRLPIDPANFQIVREGMRKGALIGSASGLNVPYVQIAAKTGTAELGVSKAYVNSWVNGFFPYQNPKYAFIVMMERGPRGNLFGATSVMRQMFDWMHSNNSPYLAE